ncbi:MAG: type II toxin-antitoxin system HicB family antitoxin [Kiritimatiellia bacterium]
MTRKFTAIVEQDEEGFYAFCPELKGCHTDGTSVEDALRNLQEAVELYLETLSPEELTELGGAKLILSTSLDVACA